MDDYELITKVKENNDENSLVELIERHSGVYNTMVSKFLSGDENAIDRMDFIDSKDFNIYSSALTYDPNKKTKFPTYLANKTRWSCLNILTKKKRFRRVDAPIDNYSEVPSNLNEESPLNQQDSMDQMEVFLLFKKYVEENFSKKMQKVVDMRYNSGSNKLTPWRLVAKEVGMSIQGVINMHNRCISDFKKQKTYV